MTNNRGLWEKAIAPGMVALVMSIDHCPNRQRGYALNGCNQSLASRLCETGINHNDRIGPHNKGRIIQPPAPIRLNISIDPIAHLLQSRWTAWYLACMIVHARTLLLPANQICQTLSRVARLHYLMGRTIQI